MLGGQFYDGKTELAPERRVQRVCKHIELVCLVPEDHLLNDSGEDTGLKKTIVGEVGKADFVLQENQDENGNFVFTTTFSFSREGRNLADKLRVWRGQFIQKHDDSIEKIVVHFKPARSEYQAVESRRSSQESIRPEASVLHHMTFSDPARDKEKTGKDPED